MDIKRRCLRYFSLKDPIREYFIYSGNDSDKKPIFGIEHDVIYITSGFMCLKDSYIQSLKWTIRDIKPRDGKNVSVTMNRNPRSQLQNDCIDNIVKSNKPKITIEVKPGVGKEQPYSTMIPTPNGYTRMGDLKIGDQVYGRDGRPTTIINIFEQGVKDVYKVTFQDGRVSYCGLEHLWNVKTHNNGHYKTMMLKDMIPDFKRINKWKLDHHRDDPYIYKYSIPCCEPVRYPTYVTPINPWVLGCFIGNGCLREKYLTISSGNDWIPKKIAALYNFNVKRCSLKNYSYTFYDPNTDKPILTEEFFKYLPDLINSYSRDKRIPACYIVNDVNTRIEILRGLMDTDGSIIPNASRYNVSYSSTSINLLRDIQQLIYSFGYSATITEDKRVDKYTNGYCGRLNFRIPNAVKHLFFTLPAKHEIAMEAVNIEQENIYNSLLIKNIEFSHREQCRCIMVDNPEHLYLTEDYIVTHNTFMALYSISKLGKKPLIVAPTTLLKNQWIENLTDLGIDKEDIATKIQDSPNKTFTVVTITSIENALRDDWKGLMDTIDKADFGIKIVDEAHLHMKGLLKFDAICNIKRNWYLSATLGRSDQDEDRILNRALLDAERFVGSAKYEEYRDEYINIYLQDIHYNASRALCEQHFKYGKKGLISATYYRMLMDYRMGQPFYSNIIRMVKIADKIKEKDTKVVVLLPLLDAIREVINRMKQDDYFKNVKISMVDGSMSISEKRKALENDLILSTTASLGTGVDVMNLGAVVNFDQKSSLIILEQMVGRLRNRGFETYYIDVCDHVKYAKAFQKWGIKRRQAMNYFPGVHKEMKRLPDIRC
jgi:superfamily II DNA or RNA helicase